MRTVHNWSIDLYIHPHTWYCGKRRQGSESARSTVRGLDPSRERRVGGRGAACVWFLFVGMTRR